MRTGARWHEDAPGQVTIEQGGIGPARLFGLPFAAVGAYFLSHFLGGLVHPSELTIAGWVLLPLMTAAFLVPGWILLFGRKRTRIDASRREAVEEFAFLVYTRRVVSRIPPDAHVLLRYEKGGPRTVKGAMTDTVITGFDTHVYLVPDQKRMILLGLFAESDKLASLDFARNVAALLGIDVRDRRVEGGEVTAGGVVVDRLGPDEAG